MNEKRKTGVLRRLAAAGLAGGLLWCSAQASVSAAALEDVFDEHYYADHNEDLKAVFGYDRVLLWNHYIRYGLAEGRNANNLVNVAMYRQQNADLNAAFGDDWNAYLNHYLTSGAKEGRESWAGTEFDAFDYAARYADLQAAFGEDVYALWKHYQTSGAQEGRDARSAEGIAAAPGSGTAGAAGIQDASKPQTSQAASQPQGTAASQTPSVPLTGQTPEVSSNVYRQNYIWYNNYNWNWAQTVKSYLYENPKGELTRVEFTGGRVVVEDYNNNYQLCGKRDIPMELPIWGGFFAGQNYNFVIFGQENPTQNDGMEVIRVVKYSKEWERLGHTSLYGANTTVPFDAGSLRCTEYGDYLYIRTCHEMYMASDGHNHQANLTMTVRQSDMALTDSYYIVMNYSVGYVSHSFNQFVLVDQDRNIVTLDHGDAHPRSIVLMRYNGAKAGGDKFSGSVTSSSLVTFPGQSGDNVTGASVGGFAETAGGYVTIFNYDGIGGGGTREVYIGYTSKDGLVSTVNRLTESQGCLTPVIVSTGLDGGVIMWNELDGTFYCARYAEGGVITSAIKTQGSLSDCQPILHNGKIVWYVTNNNVPGFFELTPDLGALTLNIANGR